MNLLQCFTQDIIQNKRYFAPKNNNIRFMTFNVHMWKDFNNKNTYSKILELIKDSNADVVGLQEAMLYSKTSQNYKNDFKKIGYPYIIVSNTKYGINMLLSKFEILESNILKLDKDPVHKLFRYAIIAKLQIHEPIIIAVTHLDVYDETEQTRLNQIISITNELNKHNNFQIILMGDFNSLRQKDYSSQEWNKIVSHDIKRNVTATTLVTDYLETHKFLTQNIQMSVWSMRRVDYIYTKNLKFNIQHCDTYPTDVSDHYPVYIDIST